MSDLKDVILWAVFIVCFLIVGWQIYDRQIHTDYCSLKIGDYVTAIPCDKYYENKITINIDGSDFHFTKWFEEVEK